MSSSNPSRVKRLERAVALRWVTFVSVVAAVILTAFLSVQMALGSDPALGPKASRQASTSQSAPTTTQTAPTTVVPTQVPSSPTVVTPVPVQVPVPAPAPVQTTTS